MATPADISPTRHTYLLSWYDGKSKPGAAYKTHHHSSLPSSTRFVPYPPPSIDRNGTHIHDATYTIPAVAAFHGSKVDPFAFHVTLFSSTRGEASRPRHRSSGP
ncbi:hypothetical protein PG984_007054 [Apiospora sp. TS-2023a]